jgi:hypothetical protein
MGHNIVNSGLSQLQGSAMTRTYEEKGLVLELWEQGKNKSEIERITGIPRRTVGDCIKQYQTISGLDEERHNKELLSPANHVHNSEQPELQKAYVYLLGLYLGDGDISKLRATYRLRVTLDIRYPNIIRGCADAMKTVFPNNTATVIKQPGNYVIVVCLSNALPILYPQHGPGEKHTRLIKLEPWQEVLVKLYPLEIWRGLFHSDGSRFSNPAKGKDYPRYQFTNYSEGIRQIFLNACEALGDCNGRRNRTDGTFLSPTAKTLNFSTV